MIGILSTVGRLLGGVLAEKLKRHRAQMGSFGLFLAAAALMLIPVTNSFWSFLVVCCCIGCA